MPSDIWKLDDEPIIIVEITELGDVESDVREIAEYVDELMEDDGTTYYRILDFSNIDLAFSQLVGGLSGESTGQPGTMSDPRIIPVIVGSADMVNLAAESFKQEQYGGIDVLLFKTREAALEHIRHELY